MSKYKALLFDLDDTLLDFKKGELCAVKAMFEKYNIAYTKENIDKYRDANLKGWHNLELGKATKDEILVNRFKEFFESINLQIEDGFDVVNKYFLDYLSHESYLVEGALDVLKELKKNNYKIFLISNGIKYVQMGRLNKQQEMCEYLDKIYLSDDLGIVKPDKRFIDFILNDNKDLKREDLIIIGDSLTSDVKLGVNTNIDTILVLNGYINYNLNKNTKTYDKPTYIVYNLYDVLNLLK